MSEPRVTRPPGRLYVIYLLALSVWMSMILMAPLLASIPGLAPMSGPIYSVFSWACHQDPRRCLTIWGRPMAVCARCTFIYLGVLVASLLYPVVGSPPVPRARFLFIAALPLCVDGGTQLLGLRSSTTSIRALTGLLFGMALAFYVAPQVEDALSPLLESRKKRGAPGTRGP